jgi:hypothetical protein
LTSRPTKLLDSSSQTTGDQESREFSKLLRFALF